MSMTGPCVLGPSYLLGYANAKLRGEAVSVKRGGPCEMDEDPVPRTFLLEELAPSCEGAPKYRGQEYLMFYVLRSGLSFD